MEPRRQFYFQWHITKACNLRCAHCYQEDYGRAALGIGDLLAIADHMVAAARRWNVGLRVSLTGGEPLQVPDLWPLAESLEARPEVDQIGILTNGTLVDAEACRKLSGLRKLREVQVSLDGASATTHDRMRGRGAFDRAVDGIRRLKAAGLPVAVMYTLSPDNAADAVPVCDLVASLGVDSLTVERVTPCGTGRGLGVMSPEAVHATYAEVHRWAGAQPPGAHLVRVRRRRPLWAAVDPADPDLGGFCPVGLWSLTVLEDGTLLPCRRLEVPIGNVLRDHGFFKAWYTSPVLWRIRQRRPGTDPCGTCEVRARCGGCRAVAYALTGDYLGEDPQCWLRSHRS